MNKFLFLVIVVAAVVVVAPITNSSIANAQTTPPLEKPLLPTAVEDEPEKEPVAEQSLGKITIQISQTEQIILDLPLKSDNKYQVAPIK